MSQQHGRQSAIRPGLQTWLLVPSAALILIALIGLGAIQELTTRRQVETLVGQRGESVLGGIAQRLQERRRANVIFSQLLANDSSLAALVEQHNSAGLAQSLVPQQARLGVGRITVYDNDGRPLLQLGVDHAGVDITPLISGARAGLTPSTVEAARDGLAVIAAAPIKGANGIAGVMVVGGILTGADLEQIKSRDGVELAVFRSGKMITTTINEPAIRQYLEGSDLTSDRWESLRRRLVQSELSPSRQSLQNDGLIVALVPTRDIVRANRQARTALLAGMVALLGILFVIAVALARRIVGPLRMMLTATHEMVRGNYDLRVAPVRIRELNQLGESVNVLAGEVRQQLDNLSYQAYFDTLTGLPNRALFMDRLNQALSRRSASAEIVAVLFLDLDHFKVINDSLGHAVGDQLLVEVARRLQACMRVGDTVARLGGDEFTVLSESTGDIAEAEGVAVRIARQLDAVFTIDGRDMFINASIGIVVVAANDGSADDLLRNADAAMYEAKSHGRGRFEVFDLAMGDRVSRRLELETGLRRAIERDEFEVHYQPIVDLATGRLSEVEALVRWQHPERGLIPPIEFIPLAEETGLILPMGRWVLREACRQVRSWHMQRPADVPLVLNVNLSSREFQHPGLIADIIDMLEETKFDPTCLKLEITESAMMRDGEAAIATLTRLRQMGIKLAIDDFGTGYSSLAYLQRFPIDILKIDQSFVQHMGEGRGDEAIVGTIMSLAKILKLSVTGEGIETHGQLDRLRALGCDHGQGYFLSRPLTAGAMQELLATGIPHASAEPDETFGAAAA